MVSVTPEPAGLEAFGIEHCCVCDQPTKFWYTPKDIALCPSCAQIAVADALPCKENWIASQQRLHPRTPWQPRHQ